MLDVHHANAFLVIAVCVAAGATALLARRRGGAGRVVSHVVAAAQTLLVAQLLFGLVLLAEHKRAADRLHYAYGVFALLAVFAPFLYAPAEPRSRLLWFGGASLLAAALAARAYMTAT